MVPPPGVDTAIALLQQVKSSAVNSSVFGINLHLSCDAVLPQLTRAADNSPGWVFLLDVFFIFVANLKLITMSGFDYFVKVLKNYTNFEGRARRSEYWYFTLFSVIISIVLSFADAAIGSEVGIIGLIFSLGTLLPSIAVSVRRMHDVGKSGWYILIPIYNLILACTDSQTGSNEYGNNPKEDPLQDEVDAIGNN